MPELDQILNAINVGLVTLDRDITVQSWNDWMETHSGVPKDRIVGSPLFRFFPALDNPSFIRSCKSVLSFGSFAFFSQKLHRFLFPFSPPRALGVRFDHMQQSCMMGPIRRDDGAIESLFLVVQDVTHSAAHAQKLREMNMRDGVTGAFSRRYFDHRLAIEFERFRRFGRSLSLLVLDVDHFKEINDRFGHPCGDGVLTAMAARVAAGLRAADFVARYGGDEFCCLLPETDLSGALVAAERIRAAVESQEHRWDGKAVPITISVGAAEAKKGLSGPADLLRHADAALYAAKRAGRNRVVALE